tara:strand:- start:110 stop:250 length:141 start_codon:yes stop_codon:yes gene_type:complete
MTKDKINNPNHQLKNSKMKKQVAIQILSYEIARERALKVKVIKTDF